MAKNRYWVTLREEWTRQVLVTAPNMRKAAKEAEKVVCTYGVSAQYYTDIPGVLVVKQARNGRFKKETWCVEKDRICRARDTSLARA